MDKYHVESTIGSGATSFVKLARCIKTGKYVVLKQYFALLSQLSSEDRRHLSEEISILSSLSHPNIIRFVETFIQHDSQVLVMEYANAQSLRSYSNYLKEKGAHIPVSILISWILTIADVLEYLHSEHIIHRDLKPENILLTSTPNEPLSDKERRSLYSPSRLRHLQLRVADFGIAREATDVLICPI